MPQKQADLLDRAAMCERASQATTDPQERASLRVLRDLWTELAKRTPRLSNTELAKEIAVIEQLHAAALGTGHPAGLDTRRISS